MKKIKLNNINLPLINEQNWCLFEKVFKNTSADQITDEMKNSVLVEMRQFNAKMISHLALFKQKNLKSFSRHDVERIRINLQDLIDNIYFDFIQQEMEQELLKNKILEQFVADMPVINGKQ